jgi:hypothetical protein
MTERIGTAIFIILIIAAAAWLIVKNPEPFDPNDEEEL